MPSACPIFPPKLPLRSASRRKYFAAVCRAFLPTRRRIEAAKLPEQRERGVRRRFFPAVRRIFVRLNSDFGKVRLNICRGSISRGRLTRRTNLVLVRQGLSVFRNRGDFRRRGRLSPECRRNDFPHCVAGIAACFCWRRCPKRCI